MSKREKKSKVYQGRNKHNKRGPDNPNNPPPDGEDPKPDRNSQNADNAKVKKPPLTWPEQIAKITAKAGPHLTVADLKVMRDCMVMLTANFQRLSAADDAVLHVHKSYHEDDLANLVFPRKIDLKGHSARQIAISEEVQADISLFSIPSKIPKSTLDGKEFAVKCMGIIRESAHSHALEHLSDRVRDKTVSRWLKAYCFIPYTGVRIDMEDDERAFFNEAENEFTQLLRDFLKESGRQPLYGLTVEVRDVLLAKYVDCTNWVFKPVTEEKIGGIGKTLTQGMYFNNVWCVHGGTPIRVNANLVRRGFPFDPDPSISLGGYSNVIIDSSLFLLESGYDISDRLAARLLFRGNQDSQLYETYMLWTVCDRLRTIVDDVVEGFTKVTGYEINIATEVNVRLRRTDFTNE